MEYNLIATTTFGLEGITSRELKALGYDDLKVENGKVEFIGDEMDIAIANVHLRTADRVFIKMAEFQAKSFEELFQGTKAVKWSEIIPVDGVMHVVGKSVNSTLHSVPDCQSIVKKAIETSMSESYGVDTFSEDGPVYKIQVAILKDKVTLSIDTSGAGLHKRGYREKANKAPIRETLAAGIMYLTPWRPGRTLVDPLCGSGTLLIEAAMMGINMAPGLNREFISEKWRTLDKKIWWDTRREAYDMINEDIEFKIYGYDIDEDVIEIARENAEIAGVADYIEFNVGDATEFTSAEEYGFIVTNPPYGERLEDVDSVKMLYKQLGYAFRKLNNWSYYLITSYEDFENEFGQDAIRKRKLYNGMLKSYLYQYPGPKPPRK